MIVLKSDHNPALERLMKVSDLLTSSLFQNEKNWVNEILEMLIQFPDRFDILTQPLTVNPLLIPKQIPYWQAEMAFNKKRYSIELNLSLDALTTFLTLNTKVMIADKEVVDFKAIKNIRRQLEDEFSRLNFDFYDTENLEWLRAKTITKNDARLDSCMKKDCVIS